MTAADVEVTRAREQSRARYPDARRLRRARRRARRSTRSTATARRRSCCCRRGRSSIRASGRPRSRTSRGTARVVTFDGRGNGRSDRPDGRRAVPRGASSPRTRSRSWTRPGRERATLVGCSRGALWATILAADHAERVEGVVYISPAVPLGPEHAARLAHPFDEELDTDEGWAKFNSRFWSRDYRAFLEFFFAQCFSEPHSTKQVEDAVGWGLETDPDTLADTNRAVSPGDADGFRERCARVRCPVLVIHGDGDRIRPHALGAALAAATGGRLVTLAGSGHLPQARDPVKVNLLLRDFVVPRRRPQRVWTRGARPPEAGALRLLADRARPRAARRRDRRRAAQAPSRPRDRLARAEPRHVGARSGRRADPSGERAPRERVRPHRVGVCGARPPLLPGVATDGRDPRSPTSCSSTTSSATTRMTSGSATRRGSWTTSCTRTRS